MTATSKPLVKVLIGITLIFVSHVEAAQNQFKINLYTGISNMVTLGQTRKELLEKVKLPYSEVEVPDEENFKQTGLSSALKLPDHGVRVYFKNNIASLILIEPPFEGIVIEKNLPIFPCQKPLGITWQDFLEQKFGKPALTRSNTSSVIGDIFYYNWGEIGFGGTGLRRVLLYRDPSIKRFRELMSRVPKDIID